MKKFEYDLLLGKHGLYTYGIIEQYQNNVTMKNIHHHSHYEILYIFESERTLVAEDKQYVLDKNHIALIPPYTLHRTVGKQGTGGKYKKYMINFTKTFVEKLSALMAVDLFSAFKKEQILIQLDDEEVSFVKNTMLEMFKYNSGGEVYDEQMFLMLLGCLLSFFAKKTAKENGYKENMLVDRMIQYMENNFEQDITLESMAKQFFISKYEISRMFTKNVGISFLKCLNRIRIEQAKKMLLETTVSITQISDMTGFHSPSNFARVFKKTTGIAPVQYRKENGNIVE